MSAGLIAFVGCIYLYIACEEAIKANYWMSIVFFGYALANTGLYKLARAEITG